MAVRLGPPVSEAQQQATRVFVVTERGSARCVLEGYPTVALVDRHHRVIPFTYSHRGDEMIIGARPKPITLGKGETAYFAFNKTNCPTPTNRLAHSVRLRFPGSRRTMRVPSRLYPLLNYCGPGASARITITPFERPLELVG